MSKIALIVQREFLTRIRKRSFIFMALLGPFMLALGMIVPLWLGSSTEDVKIIEVIDNQGTFKNKFPEMSGVKFIYVNGDVAERLPYFIASEHYAMITINEKELNDVVLYSKTRPTPEIKIYLQRILNQIISIEKIKRASIDENLLKDIESDVSIVSKSISNDWEDERAVNATVVIALFSAVLILFFIVLYGGQVMRGVIEEKTNRIIEVMISSVKPFELMMGKILGIALVSLTQFLIWVFLTASISFYFNTKYKQVFDMYSNEHIEATLKANPNLDVSKAMEVNSMITALDSVNFTQITLIFTFYFLGGYLLYSALFAAIGSSVDAETDTQQFIFPLIAPLMFCIAMATSIILNPDSDLAFWLSMIPFTSPVAMMLRIPFGVDASELVISMLILAGSFVLFTWLAGRVYRVGVLMYGKKASIREIIKWTFYNR
jgi:ABC-2 type transport system permease protein